MSILYSSSWSGRTDCEKSSIKEAFDIFDNLFSSSIDLLNRAEFLSLISTSHKVYLCLVTLITALFFKDWSVFNSIKTLYFLLRFLNNWIIARISWLVSFKDINFILYNCIIEFEMNFLRNSGSKSDVIYSLNRVFKNRRVLNRHMNILSSWNSFESNLRKPKRYNL